MIWVLFAFLHSMLRAAYTEAGRRFDVDSWLMTFWAAVFGALILCAFTPFMVWPEDPRFYFAAGIVGVMFAVGSLILLGLIAERSGRVAAIYMPLEVMMAIIIWVLITPGELQSYIDDPLRTAGIIMAWVMAAAGLYWIRPNDFNIQTLSIVAPLGVTYAVIGVVTKIVMPTEGAIPYALSFILVMLAVMAVTMLIALGLKKMLRPAMFHKRVLAAGAVTGLFGVSAYATFVLGVSTAPNPGFVSFLIMLLPVWLLIWHMLHKRNETSSLPAAAIMVLSVMILLAATI